MEKVKGSVIFISIQSIIIVILVTLHLGLFQNTRKCLKTIQELSAELDTYKGLIVNKDQEISELTVEVEDLNNQMEVSLDETSELVAKCYYTFDELNRQNSNLSIEYNLLVDKYNDAMEELNWFHNREELFDQYEYALFDRSGNRTDITYKQILLVEEVTEKYGLADPNLILGIIMCESGGQSDAKNSKSAASGYAQFLPSTGRYVYENIMEKGKGSFSRDLLFDGDISIEMMGAYLRYLLDHNGNSLVKAIKSYSGDTSKDSAFTYRYMEKINSYIKCNTTMSTISNKIKGK